MTDKELASLRDAHAAGLRIQVLMRKSAHWETLDHPAFDSESQYRVHPDDDPHVFYLGEEVT